MTDKRTNHDPKRGHILILTEIATQRRGIEALANPLSRETFWTGHQYKSLPLDLIFLPNKLNAYALWHSIAFKDDSNMFLKIAKGLSRTLSINGWNGDKIHNKFKFSDYITFWIVVIKYSVILLIIAASTETYTSTSQRFLSFSA